MAIKFMGIKLLDLPVEGQQAFPLVLMEMMAQHAFPLVKSVDSRVSPLYHFHRDAALPVALA